MEAKLLNPEQEVDTLASHKLQDHSQADMAQASSDKAEFIETAFTEKYTLFIEDKHAFENMTKEHMIRTEKKVPKLGVMLVGLGGNNGSTMVAGILANKKKLTWDAKSGP